MDTCQGTVSEFLGFALGVCVGWEHLQLPPGACPTHPVGTTRFHVGPLPP